MTWRVDVSDKCHLFTPVAAWLQLLAAVSPASPRGRSGFTVSSYHSGRCCLGLNGRSTNLFCQNSIASFSASLPLMLWLILFPPTPLTVRGSRERASEWASEMRLKDTRPKWEQMESVMFVEADWGEQHRKWEENVSPGAEITGPVWFILTG